MAAASSQHRCVFVGNIPYDATEQQLIQICEEVGPVVSFRLVLDRETGKPKGYGFCEYKDEETALSARRNLQGYDINGRQLRVDFAENDKGTDRNREQGRGGPGLTSNIDAQKPLGGPTTLGDSALHQPLGLPLAATAASVMTGALGEAQTAGSSSIQNVLQSQSGLGNDPLTHYLAKMSRHQLHEIMSEIKSLAAQNKALAQQLLQGSSQLPKALFQAEIMLGMVPPQMLQMANIRQSSSSAPYPSIQDGMQDQKPLLPSYLGQTPFQKETQIGMLSRPPEGQVSNVPQNPLILQHSALPPQHVPFQPRFQHPPLPPQAQGLLPRTMPGNFGVSTIPSLRPQSHGGFSIQLQTPPLPTSKGLIPQIQPPLLQNPGSVGSANMVQHHLLALPNTSRQQSLLPHPVPPQTGSLNYPVLLGGLETHSKEAGASAYISHDARMNTHSSSGAGLVEQTGMVGDISELISQSSKRARLEDASNAPQMMNRKTSIPISAQPIGTGSISRSEMADGDGMQHSEKEIPQLAPEVESALLQQVMSLTPEQLSSLPPEQRQQVLQLQQMLHDQKV